jgi:hypothetical protein
MFVKHQVDPRHLYWVDNTRIIKYKADKRNLYQVDKTPVKHQEELKHHNPERHNPINEK